MRFNHIPLIIFSGLIWFAIGLFLLSKGLNFLVAAAHESGPVSPLIQWLAPLTGGLEGAALLMIATGLLVGFIKGRYVLDKSVTRVVERILSLPAPVKITQIYSARYYALILTMIGLGLSLKWFQLDGDIRGLVDVAIGSALMNGSLLYFRRAAVLKKA